MLALHLLQSSLVFINTQLLQAVLRDPAWAGKLTEEDRRGLSPLFWSHVNPYLDKLQNCYGAWTSGFPGRPGPEGCWRSSEPASRWRSGLPGDGQLGHGLLLNAGPGRS